MIKKGRMFFFNIYLNLLRLLQRSEPLLFGISPLLAGKGGVPAGNRCFCTEKTLPNGSVSPGKHCFSAETAWFFKPEMLTFS
jgi:hypothetical protein